MRYFEINDPYALIAAPYRAVARKLYLVQVTGDTKDADDAEIIEVDYGHALASFRRANPEIPMLKFLGKFDQYKNIDEGLVLLVDNSLM